MADFDLSESKTTLGSVSWIFFQQHRGSLCAWAHDGKPLEDRLRHLVLGFSTGLNVMQRLEARHHLVNLALARGRALSVPGVISGLRRRFNQDLQQQSFREELPKLLNDFDQLVLQPWDSQRQLLQLRPFTVINELLLTVISNSYKLLITVILTDISRDLTSCKSYL